MSSKTLLVISNKVNAFLCISAEHFLNLYRFSSSGTVLPSPSSKNVHLLWDQRILLFSTENPFCHEQEKFRFNSIKLKQVKRKRCSSRKKKKKKKLFWRARLATFVSVWHKQAAQWKWKSLYEKLKKTMCSCTWNAGSLFYSTTTLFI